MMRSGPRLTTRCPSWIRFGLACMYCFTRAPRFTPAPRFAPLALAGCLAVLAVLAPLPAAAGGEERVEWPSDDPRRAIVWSEDGGATEPLFVPEVLFQEKDLEELPLTARQRLFLRTMIEERRNPERFHSPARLRDPDCTIDVREPPAAGTMPGALDLPELASRNGVSVVGQIVAVVPGLAMWSRVPVHLAYVRVDQILAVDRGSLLDIDPPEVGEVISVPFWGAKIRIAGFAVCSPISEQFYAPREGDWILVVGGPQYRNHRLYSSTFKFPIRNDVVQPQPYPALSLEAKPRPLGQLIDELRAIKVEQ